MVSQASLTFPHSGHSIQGLLMGQARGQAVPMGNLTGLLNTTVRANKTDFGLDSTAFNPFSPPPPGGRSSLISPLGKSGSIHPAVLAAYKRKKKEKENGLKAIGALGDARERGRQRAREVRR